MSQQLTFTTKDSVLTDEYFTQQNHGAYKVIQTWTKDLNTIKIFNINRGKDFTFRHNSPKQLSAVLSHLRKVSDECKAEYDRVAERLFLAYDLVDIVQDIHDGKRPTTTDPIFCEQIDLLNVAGLGTVLDDATFHCDKIVEDLGNHLDGAADKFQNSVDSLGDIAATSAAALDRHANGFTHIAKSIEGIKDALSPATSIMSKIDKLIAGGNMPAYQLYDLIRTVIDMYSVCQIATNKHLSRASRIIAVSAHFNDIGLRILNVTRITTDMFSTIFVLIADWLHANIPTVVRSSLKTNVKDYPVDETTGEPVQFQEQGALSSAKDFFMDILSRVALAAGFGPLLLSDPEVAHACAQFSKIANAQRTASSSLTSTFRTIMDVISLVKSVFNGTYQERKHNERRAQAWIEMNAHYINNVAEMDRITKDKGHADAFLEHIKVAHMVIGKLSTYSSKTNNYAQLIRGIESSLNAVKDKIKIAKVTSKVQKMRSEPIYAIFKGQTGIGKTTIIPALSAMTLAAAKRIPTPDDFIEARDLYQNMGGEFCDGYKGQAIWYEDDLGQVRDNEMIKESLQRLFAFASHNPVLLNMADVEKKETTPFESDFIFATVNKFPFHSDFSSLLTEPEAFERRWEYKVEIEVKPGCYDAQAKTIAVAARGRRDVYDFKVNFRGKHIHSPSGRGVFTFEELAAHMGQTYIDRQAMAKTTFTDLLHSNPQQTTGVKLPMPVPEAMPISEYEGAIKDIQFTSPQYYAGMFKEQGLSINPTLPPVRIAIEPNFVDLNITGRDSNIYVKSDETIAGKPLWYGLTSRLGYSTRPDIFHDDIIQTIIERCPAHHSSEMPCVATQLPPRSMATYVEHLRVWHKANEERPCHSNSALATLITDMTVNPVPIHPETYWTRVLKEAKLASSDIMSILEGLCGKAQAKLERCAQWLKMKAYDPNTYFGIIDNFFKIVNFVSENILTLFVSSVGLGVVIGALYKIYRHVTGSRADPVVEEFFTIYEPEEQAASASGSQVQRKHLAKRMVPKKAIVGRVKYHETIESIQEQLNALRSFEASYIFDHELDKPTSPTVSGKWCPDLNAQDILRSAAVRNVCRVRGVNPKGRTCGMFATGLFDKVIALPFHFIHELIGREIPLREVRNNIDHYLPKLTFQVQMTANPAWYEVKEFQIAAGDEDNSDLCFIKMINVPILFADQTDKYIDCADWDKIQQISNVGITVRPKEGTKGEGFALVPAQIMDFHVRDQMTCLPAAGGSGDETISSCVILARGSNAEGYCGLPYAHCQKNVQRKLMGIHYGGNTQSGHVIIQSITHELVKAVKEYFETNTIPGASPPVYQESLELLEKTPETSDSMYWADEGRFRILGGIPKELRPRIPVTHNIVPSLIATDSPATLPAELRPRAEIFNGEERLRLAQTDSVMKQACPDIVQWDHTVVKVACSQLTSNQRRHISTLSTKKELQWEPLTEEQNLAGFGDINQTNTKTSPGLPWMSTLPDFKQVFKKPKMGGKTSFLNDDGSLTPEFAQVVFDLEEKCKRMSPAVLSYIFNKAERRLPNKVKSPRTISVFPYEFTYVFRKYYGAYMDFIIANHNQSEIAIGLNAMNWEWEHAYRRLEVVGRNKIAFDYKAFDKAQPFQLSTTALDIIEDYFYQVMLKSGKTPEKVAAYEQDKVVRRNLWYSAISCHYVNHDTVFHTLFGNPSGGVLTTQQNCVVNQLYIRLAYLEITKRHDFDEHVRVLVYGDDLVMCVSDEIFAKFNFITIKRYFASYNVIITWPDKRREDHEDTHCSDEDFTFLKRGFTLQKNLFEAYPGEEPRKAYNIFGTLDVETIEEIPQWINGKLDHRAATIDNYETACMLAAQWPEEVYDKIMAKFEENLTHLPNYAPLGYATWRRKIEDMRDAGQEELLFMAHRSPNHFIEQSGDGDSDDEVSRPPSPAYSTKHGYEQDSDGRWQYVNPEVDNPRYEELKQYERLQRDSSVPYGEDSTSLREQASNVEPAVIQFEEAMPSFPTLRSSQIRAHIHFWKNTLVPIEHIQMVLDALQFVPDPTEAPGYFDVQSDNESHYSDDWEYGDVLDVDPHFWESR